MHEIVEHPNNNFCHLADLVKTIKHTLNYELLKDFLDHKVFRHYRTEIQK